MDKGRGEDKHQLNKRMMLTEQVQLRCPLGQNNVRHFCHLESREEISGILVLPDERRVGERGEGLQITRV